MNLNLKHLVIILSIAALSACTQESELSKQIRKLRSPDAEAMAMKAEQAATLIPVKINSVDELAAFFDSINYNMESWQSGNRAVPRIIFSNVPQQWQEENHQITVNEKKVNFFKLMLPIILLANEEIDKEYQQAQAASVNSTELLYLAKKYKIVDRTVKADALTESIRQQLLQRIGKVPPSLALAQAAIESGWGTSRFTVEGNAFFGQWDFSGKGMKPKRQRKELGNYGLAKFDSPLKSVQAYMLNINTSHAYEQFRAKRLELLEQNQTATGLILSDTLINYSERGQAYVNDIRSLINYNKLQSTDEGYLIGLDVYQVITDNQDNKHKAVTQ